MATFAADSYVFIPDDDDMFLPAQVVSSFESGKPGEVKVIQNGKKASKPRRLDADESRRVTRMDEQSLRPIDDMVQLKNLDEPAILHNLRLRYDEDVIYTSVGRILVSINPFKMLPIYSPQVMDEYLENGSRDLDPHVYGVADDAFRAMISTKKNQSCIVSGESGAGKTEATKLFLQYIAEKSRREAGSGKSQADDVGSIHNRVLEANPVMEAFGNAKTVRNNNSSRFGKFINITFKNGEIVGGSIENYLLEKSRLVRQAEGERNYHIFYQICAAANMSPDMKEKYSLSDATQYYYLNQSKKAATEIPNVDDADEWKSTLMAMEVVNLGEKDVESIIMLLAGILHLGNIRFTKGSSEDSSQVQNTDMLELAAEQLGMKPDDLSKALTQRLIQTSRDSTWGNHTVDQAGIARDALAKAAYSLIFDFLILSINKSLGTKKVKGTEIGVLDIFGFEYFEINSFEQLCINYCNEKLQNHFNDHIFKLEQAEYEREGVDVNKISFQDNEEVLALIEAPKGVGILFKIDEEIKTGRGTDASLLKKVLEMAPKSNGIVAAPDMKKMKAKPHLKNCFVFTHYAGDVEYDTTDFLEKCKDDLQVGLKKVALGSKNALLKTLFSEASAAEGKKKSLGIQFRDQLGSLMDVLNRTSPHFVRCIKPNSTKVGNRFTADMVLSQLRYAGLLEVCRIRKQGYPIRKTFDEFHRTYRPLSQGAVTKDAPSLCKRLEDMDILIKDEYQVGKNKVFLRDDMFDSLEVSLEKVLSEKLRLVQSVARGFIIRCRAKKWKSVRQELDRALKTGNIENLTSAVLACGVLPYGGRHLSWVARAKDELERLEEEARITELLETALESKDLSEIKRALKAAEEKGMGSKKLIDEAKATIKKIEEEKKIRDELRAAVDQGDDMKMLQNALSKAEKAGIKNTVEARDADALLTRLKEQTKALEDLEKAINKKNVGEIKKLMNRLAELGQKSHPLVIQGQEVAREQAKASKEREEQQERLLEELEKAMAAKDLQKLNDLEVEVLSIGLEEHELVKTAMDLRKKLEKSAEILSTLTSEMRAAVFKAQSAEGISSKEIDAISDALTQGKKQGVSDDDPKIVEATELIAKLEKQLQAQKDLDDIVGSIESKKKNKKDMSQTLTDALRQAQALGVDTTSARKIRDWVTTIEQEEAEFNQAELVRRRAANLERLKEATKDELEQLAMERLSKLASEKHRRLLDMAKDDSVYELKKFYKIRTNEDFTESLPDDERAIAAKLKLWSRQKPIPKSLLKLSDEQNRTALRINRAILQYCGDMSTSFPATLAQYMLVKGLEDPAMCDEIYCQLCKHVYVNPKPESTDRAWLLFCMASKTFPPSEAFAPYLLNFLLKNQTLPGLPGNYARLCIVQLDATIELGPSWFKPNLEEIQCYRKRPPILAPIHQVDGEVVQYPITPDLRVAQVVDLIRRQLDIDDNIEVPTWGIFVKDGKENGKPPPKVRLENFYRHYNPSKLRHVSLFLEHWKGKEEELFAKLVEKYGPEPEDSQNKKKSGLLSVPVTGAMQAVKMLGLTTSKKAPPAPQTGWPLPWWAHLGDVYLRMTTQGKEPVFEFKRRMITPDVKQDKRLYLQLLQDLKSGDLFLAKESDVAEAALIAVAMEQKGFKLPKVDKLPEAGLTKFMSPYWRRLKSPEDWARVAAASASEKLPRVEQKLIDRFVSICKKSDVYGMTFFYARRSDMNQDFVVGVDSRGIHFIEKSDSKTTIVDEVMYNKIIKYGATVEYFWMNVDDKASKAKKTAFNLGGQGVNVLLYTLQSWELYETVFDWTHVGA